MSLLTDLNCAVYEMRCNKYPSIEIADALHISDEDVEELLDQFDIDDWQVDEVIQRASILAPVDAFNKTITPVVWEED